MNKPEEFSEEDWKVFTEQLYNFIEEVADVIKRNTIFQSMFAPKVA